jgi:hypothetical protein
MMMQDRKFWTRHVEDSRASGMTQRAYCQRHHLKKGTLGYWVSTLKKPRAAGSELLEVGHTQVKEQKPSVPIELIVEGRYLLRLWSGVEPAHMREVLSVLECRL